jgi:hypothetical protein
MSYRKTQARAIALCATLGMWACGDDDESAPVNTVDASATVADAGPAAPPPPAVGVQTDAAITTPLPVVGADASSAAPITGADAGGGPSVPALPPVYVAATRVFTADGSQTTTYVQALSSIDQGSKLETSKAIEFGGPAELFSLSSPRWLAVGDGESPLLTRYTVAADQKLEKKETLSLQNYGLTSFFSNKLYQVSATKAYIPDPDSAQLFAIDPNTMKVLGAVALPDTVRAGYTPVYSYAYVKREGRILFSVAWFDYTNDKILPETGLVVLDTTTDKPVRTDVDKRCAGITQPVTVTSGDTYFPSSALAAASYQLGRLSTEPCVLLIKAGTDSFDATYNTQLKTLTGGPVAGEPIPVGGDEVFLRVLDTSIAKIAADTASWGITGQEAWRWRRWNPVTGVLLPIDALQPSTADTDWFEVDGRVFNSQTKSDYSSTQLIELNAAGGPKPGLTSPGLISGLTRVQ